MISTHPLRSLCLASIVMVSLSACTLNTTPIDDETAFDDAGQATPVADDKLLTDCALGCGDIFWSCKDKGGTDAECEYLVDGCYCTECLQPNGLSCGFGSSEELKPKKPVLRSAASTGANKSG